MTTVLSIRGQMVLPKAIRERAGIDVGDNLDVILKGNVIEIRKVQPIQEEKRHAYKVKIKDGIPYLDIPKGIKTSPEWVREQKGLFP